MEISMKLAFMNDWKYGVVIALMMAIILFACAESIYDACAGLIYESNKHSEEEKQRTIHMIERHCRITDYIKGYRVYACDGGERIIE